MAANEIMVNKNSLQTKVECIVNRWIVDYYVFLAIEVFKNGRYSDFCGIRDVLDSVLARPLESTDVMPTRIRVLQFLSRINDGDKLDMAFESDESVSPLESAMQVLENISQECIIPQQDLDKIHTSIKEMLVVICIKNKDFEKAKEVLNTHFPKGMVGKKAIFMGLINQESKTHEVLEQMNFQQFKEEMVQFCESFCPSTVPFLDKAAKQLIDKRLTEQEDNTAGPQPDQQDKSALSPGLQSNNIQSVLCSPTSNQAVIQRKRLEAAYQALAGDTDERTLAQLEEEVEREEQNKTSIDSLSLHLSASLLQGTDIEPKQDGPSQRDSDSPMEASLADQPPATDTDGGPASVCATKATSLRKRRLYTVAQLVVEPDSQWSSQCSTACQEQEAEVQPEKPAQLLALSSEEDPQSPVTAYGSTKSTQKCHRQARKTLRKQLTRLSADSEEDPIGSVATSKIPVRKLRKRASSVLSKNSPETTRLSADSEEDPLSSVATSKTPVQKPRKQASKSLSKTPKKRDKICILDSSLDSSTNLFPSHSALQKSSTPQKDSTPHKGTSYTKWKRLYSNAKETKDTWSDEESLFGSNRKNDKGTGNDSSSCNSGHKKRKWSDQETKMLKEAVGKFGEGNWSKIRANYPFKDRTNVNLKDRWRTMKKLNMV